MWLLPFLLTSALPVQGDLKVNLEQSAYPADDSGMVLDVSYEIPNTSLTFVRQDSAFVARYRIDVQVSDKRKDIVAGDVWQKTAILETYDPTMARESAQVGTVSLVVPKSAMNARVGVYDQANERSALAEFGVELPTGGLIVRLFRSGKPVSIRKYGIGDTLVVMAEAVSPTYRLDSCRFVLKQDRSVVTGAVTKTTTAEEAGGQRQEARFEYPIGDSTAVARLGGGEYSIEVAGYGSAIAGASGEGKPLQATTDFRVDVPFYLDDSVYLRRTAQLVYIASESELKHLRSVERSEREQAWKEFWKKKEHSLTGTLSVTEDEYFERIQHAEDSFGHGDRGYLSDRGHVYVVYGPPDQVDSRPFEIDSPATETWSYYQANKQFEFVDKFGTGELVLANPQDL